MKPLPRSLEAEQAVLGSCFIDNRKVQEILDSVMVEDFYSPRHQELFTQIQKLSTDKMEVDFVTIAGNISSELLVYVYGIVDNTPTAANWSVYAKILKATTIRRKIIAEAQKLQEEAEDLDTDISEVLTSAQKSILALSLTQDIPLKNTHELSLSLVKRIETPGGCQGLLTGFDGLDVKLGGLRPGKLYILAARPRMGKTAMSKNIAEHISHKYGSVFMASLEMDAEQLAMRHISGMGRVDSSKFNDGRFEDADYPKMMTAIGKYAKLPIFYDDAGYQTDAGIMAKARKIKAEKGLQLVIIDYLQLVRASEKPKSREETIASISRNFKTMAKELQVPVIALAQLNRECEKEKRRPLLSDLRESGGIEQDADAIIFIHRDHEYNPDKPESDAEAVVAKNRDGGTGIIDLTWNGSFTNFYNKEKWHE